MISREGISHEAFDEKLAEIVGELTPAGLLSIAGVYEALSEYFNDDVIRALEEDEDEEEEEEI